MDLIITAVVALVAAVVGWLLGQGAARRPFEESLGRLTRRLQDGDVADIGGGPQSVQAVAKVVEAGWAPASQAAPESDGDAELKQAALWEALHRVSKHLASSVKAPLETAASGDDSNLRAGVGEALGALEDIDFFLATPPDGISEIDLGETVREVIADFGAESGARPKQRGPRRPIQVKGNPDALKDALFLILHNATQFGAGRAIDVVVRVEDGHGRVHVRDRGTGFSAEALSRAYDPFYTTIDGNLGLGLAHARKLLEESGGKIHLRNSERGGGEVEVGLPLTS